MTLVSINMDNGKYLSLTVKYPDEYFDSESEKAFDSGDFIKDWYDSMKFLLVDIGLTGRIELSRELSEYIEDAPYDKAYLTVDRKTGESKLSYVKGQDPDFMEFFVPKGERPTWSQLIEYCGYHEDDDYGEQEKSTKKKKEKKEEAPNYSTMSKIDIRKLIDIALDDRDFKKVDELNKLLESTNTIKKFNEFR